MDSRQEARFLVFEAEGRRYACTLDAVREIVPFRSATRLPGAPASVIGLVNLRGGLLTIVDLAVQLGAREAGTRPPGKGSVVLIASGSQTVGVFVDQVHDVRPVPPELIDQIPTGSEDAGHGALRALARLDDGVAVVLDPQRIVADILITSA